VQSEYLKYSDRISSETVVSIHPKIGQLKLILIVATLLLIGWFYSLYSYNKIELEKARWCLNWNKRTQGEWVYDTDIGCVVNKQLDK